MSESFLAGDMVVVSDEIALPKNDLYPLVWCICDCSQNEPIAYIPYRVYTGDTVIVKSIMEGYALIPEDIGGDGKFGGTEFDSGSTRIEAGIAQAGGYCVNKVAKEGHWELVNGRYVYVPTTYTCPGYKSRGFCRKSPGNYYIDKADIPGLPPRGSACDYGYWYGFTIYGECLDRRSGVDKTAVIQSKNAYEYIDLTVTGGFGQVGDKIVYAAGMKNPPPRPLTWTQNGTNVRVECYPGYGGSLGLPQLEGGSAELIVAICVAGGGGNVFVDLSRRWPSYIREVHIKINGTGRYGNYQ